ncbi:MAG: hypothetical protein ABII22_01335 [Candidatus Micrarchaeota archaeon]
MKAKEMGIAIVVLSMILLVLFLGNNSAPDQKNAKEGIGIIEIGSIGNIAYAVLANGSSGNITAILLDELPSREIYILRKRGLGYERFDDLVMQAKEIEGYGYKVKIVDETFAPKNGTFVIPTGAMPKEILDNFDRYSETKIIYIGRKDLIFDIEMKKLEWYDEKYSGIVVKEMDLIDYFAKKDNVFRDILEGSFGGAEKYVVNVDSMEIIHLNASQHNYLRLIYPDKTGAMKVLDRLLDKQDLSLGYLDIYPGEQIEYEFFLNKTNGTAYLTIRKGGYEIAREKLQRVIEQNYFSKRFLLNQTGDFIVDVSDDTGTIGGGILHIKKIEMSLAERYGQRITVDATIDGKPIENGEALAWLEDSENTKKAFITNGQIVLRADLKKGKNVIWIRYQNADYGLTVDNNDESIIDTYLKYGIPGILVIFLIYLWTKMIKKPVYVIKLAEAQFKNRKELVIRPQELLKIFSYAKKDLDIDGPITVEEIVILLKKHFTDDAEVSEGNVEEILRSMEKSKRMASHDGYYQIGTANLEKNTMKRKVKDRLIGKGIEFHEKGDRFVTKNYEIGFFGDKFSKRAIVVFESESEKQEAIGKMSQDEKAGMRVSQFNRQIELVTLEKLEDFL